MSPKLCPLSTVSCLLSYRSLWRECVTGTRTSPRDGWPCCSQPTSGLDSTSSLQLTKALRATAKQGITVAAVLHQPRWEMFCLFDDVLLLGKGGYTVYLGPAVEAKPYFERLGYVFPAEVNPADSAPQPPQPIFCLAAAPLIEWLVPLANGAVRAPDGRVCGEQRSWTS